VPALGPYVNGPNGRAQNLEIKAIVDNFLEDELRLGHLEEFSTDIDSVNSKDSLGAGDFFILVEARTPGVRERIFILLRVGETVVIEQAA
jgi:phage tail sheath protein FI